VIQWYNLLAEKEMLNFEEETEEVTPEKAPDEAEVPTPKKKKKAE
jgi:hypothetical protein